MSARSSNVVSYSRATRFEFSCETDRDGIVLTFRDDGLPFDPTSAPDTLGNFDMLDQGGMGLNIIRQTTSHMRYMRQDSIGSSRAAKRIVHALVMPEEAMESSSTVTIKTIRNNWEMGMPVDLAIRNGGMTRWIVVLGLKMA